MPSAQSPVKQDNPPRSVALMPRRGVMLINLGTPDAADTPALRRYLRQFLMDGRVVDIPAVWRWMLVNLIIVPFRSPKSAHAYRSIWTAEGSPLLVHSRALRDALAEKLGDGYVVELAMRYGKPSIAQALSALGEQDVSSIAVVPLFPQYASATTGSAVEALYDEVRRLPHIPSLDVKPAFFDRDDYLESVASVAQAALEGFDPDFFLFSYHGLPLRQLTPVHRGSEVCASEEPCPSLSSSNRWCYRGQCFAMTRQLAQRMGLPEDRYATAFQSRLGRVPWIQPYTDHMLPKLRERGVKNLAVLSPAFVADCLETLEELGIRARETWKSLGGHELRLLPCVNAHPAFVDAMARLVVE